MSKRMGHFQLKQPLASKKPKLDIEIVPSQQYNPQPSTSNGNWKPKASNNAAKMDALWGDEDDEFIVLASQAVEEMSQQSQAFSTSGVADMTFGKFSRNVQTSTQAIVRSSSTVSKPPTLATDKQVAELFADGEDDIFTEKFDDNYENIENKLDNYFDNEFDDDFNLDEFRQEGQKPLVSGRIEPPKPPEPEPEFKVPMPFSQTSTSTAIIAQSVNVVRTTSTVGAFTPKAPSVNQSVKLSATTSWQEVSRADEQTAKENAIKKQEHAKDIQIKFFTKRLEQCEKKLETMQREHNEALEKVKIKDGEVSTLRYRLKTVNDTVENQRKEKLRETETIQKEWVEKQKELEKIIAAQTAELSFKEMELMDLRMKRLNNSRRAAEVRENQTEGPRMECVTEDSFVLCNVLSQLSVTETQEPLTLDPEVFSISTESVARHGVANQKFYHCSRGDAIIEQQLVTLQICLSQLVSRVDGKRSVQLPMAMLPVVAEAIIKGLAEVTQYCQRLVPGQAKDNIVGRPVDVGQGRLQKGRMDLVRSMSVFQRDELYPGEQKRIIRRFLAVLGLFCRISSDLMDETLLKERQISLLARNIKLVSNVSALHAHHGMVTGAAALLKGLSFHLHRITSGFTENGLQLIALFRSIVLCQISAPSAMLELSEFLRRLSYRRDDAAVLALINQLCRSHHPTGNGRPKEKYRMKTISFSEETCTLQMYATLLQSSVREEVPCEAWQFGLLLANLENTICFLRNSLVPIPVEWVKNFIVGKSSRECNLCHIRMVSAFLVLLYRVLQCWHQRTVVEERELHKLYSIARKGTLLLYDLFGTAYCSKLLLLGGDAVKYRLRIIYDWLRKYQKMFQFQAAHVKALDRLDLRLLMNDPLKSNHEPDDSKDKTESTATGTSTVENGRSDIVKQLFTGFFENKRCLQG
ncbi:uncharacterized protein LOC131262981 isoform X1 [Anopheles coustani]|uniref:uncharacterized protein LOC131262981 isoform X1 n=1 Tax=Anopheles coustani TaxID=139045 RepID=UPI0026597A48|nr:uncharacterized protein LOC131262981 isoform X1 [Anopheles coustani]